MSAANYRFYSRFRFHLSTKKNIFLTNTFYKFKKFLKFRLGYILINILTDKSSDYLYMHHTLNILYILERTVLKPSIAKGSQVFWTKNKWILQFTFGEHVGTW